MLTHIAACKVHRQIYVTSYGIAMLNQTPRIDPRSTVGSIMFASEYSMQVASFSECFSLIVVKKRVTEVVKMTKLLQAIAFLVSSLKKANMIGTMMPPPPMPEMTAKAIKIVRITVPTISQFETGTILF